MRSSPLEYDAGPRVHANLLMSNSPYFIPLNEAVLAHPTSRFSVSVGKFKGTEAGGVFANRIQCQHNAGVAAGDL